MLELDFLVIFQFGRVVFDGFVPILEGYPVSVCPHHPEGVFFEMSLWYQALHEPMGCGNQYPAFFLLEMMKAL